MKDYRNRETVAYWSDMMGIEVKGVETGIEDYLLVVAGTNTSTPTSHRLKVYSDSKGNGYIRLYGRRYKLEDCLTVAPF